MAHGFRPKTLGGEPATSASVQRGQLYIQLLLRTSAQRVCHQGMEAKPATIDIEDAGEDVVTFKPIELFPTTRSGSHNGIASGCAHSIEDRRTKRELEDLPWQLREHRSVEV